MYQFDCMGLFTLCVICTCRLFCLLCTCCSTYLFYDMIMTIRVLYANDMYMLRNGNKHHECILHWYVHITVVLYYV